METIKLYTKKVTALGEKGIAIIKEFESFRSKPYLCQARVPTIGWGSTYYPNGKRVTLRDKPITVEQGMELFKVTSLKYVMAVDRMTRDDINQNQFDALVSLCFNIGEEQFRTSTVLKRVNKNPSDKTIAEAFSRFKYADGKISKGLIRRRAAEVALYFS